MRGAISTVAAADTEAAPLNVFHTEKNTNCSKSEQARSCSDGGELLQQLYRRR